MRAFGRHTGRLAPLRRANVDTDAIIPKQFLRRTERSGYGQFLFFDWMKDPAFVLNLPQFQETSILVAGANFGCGSSREHAVWALEDRGFGVVVAPSFADIFASNCHKVGVLAVRLNAAEVERLWAAAEARPEGEYTVDLETQSVSGEDFAANFEIETFAKKRLLGGLDEVGMALYHAAEITAYEQMQANAG